MRKTKFAYVLAFAPVLMGAGYYAADEIGDNNSIGSLQNELIATTLPKCAENEYLTYASGGLTCIALTGGTVSVPDCTGNGGQLLTFTTSGEFSKFTCTDKGATALSTTDITTVNNLYQKLVTLGTDLTTIEKSPRQSAAIWVGNTDAKTNGAIASNGNTGIAGAADMCASKFGAGAHMCTVYDIYTSVAVGKLSSQTEQAQKAWVYQASWNTPSGLGSGTDPKAGLGENCGGYTYPTGDRAWFGTAFTFTKLATMQYAPRFFSGGDAACSATLPVACCK